MRTRSFLLILFFILHLGDTWSVWADQVVLKSGKQISGTFIGENDTSIQLKDAKGVVLSIKKSMVDAQATESANQDRSAITRPDLTDQRRRVKSIVEIAEESKKSRTGKSVLLTNSDVPQRADISVFGSKEAASLQISSSADSTPGKDERYWRKEASSLRREVSLMREKVLSAESKCDSARNKATSRMATPHRKADNLLVLMETPVECRKLEEVERQMKDAEYRLYDFEERARKAAVPWSWIE